MLSSKCDALRLNMDRCTKINQTMVVQKLEEFTNKQFNYYLVQYNGQRIYKLREDPEVPPPPKGTEIFVGKLPRDIFEDELVPLFAKVGPIFRFRLMVDFSGKNRGYAFVTYFTVQNALAAIEYFDGYEVRRGFKIGVYKSVDNCRLFIGNLPKDRTKEEVARELAPYVEGLQKVILYKSLQDPAENRGFAFLEFESHRAAAMTRRKLAPGTFFMWGQSILVDWADPLPDVDPNIMSRVKKLFMRNLDLQMTTEDLQFRLYEVLAPRHTAIVKVHKTLDYAFVHFATRFAAEEALRVLEENSRVFGEEIEIAWARPKIYCKENRMYYFPQTFCTSLPPKSKRLMLQLRQSGQNRAAAENNCVGPFAPQPLVQEPVVNAYNEQYPVQSYGYNDNFPVAFRQMNLPFYA